MDQLIAQIQLRAVNFVQDIWMTVMEEKATEVTMMTCKRFKKCLKQYGKCGFKGEEAECQLNPDMSDYYNRQRHGGDDDAQ